MSHGDYVRSKVLGAAAVLLRRVADAERGGPRRSSSLSATLPDGLLPFAVLLCVFMLANYSFVVCSALHAALRRADDGR